MKTGEKLTLGAIMLGGTVAAVELICRATDIKPPSQRVFEWWRDIHDKISKWVRDHQQLRIARVIGVVSCLLDDAAVAAKKVVNFVATAIDRNGQRHAIETVQGEVTADKLREQFSQFAHLKEIVIENY